MIHWCGHVLFWLNIILYAIDGNGMHLFLAIVGLLLIAAFSRNS